MYLLGCERLKKWISGFTGGQITFLDLEKSDRVPIWSIVLPAWTLNTSFQLTSQCGNMLLRESKSRSSPAVGWYPFSLEDYFRKSRHKTRIERAKPSVPTFWKEKSEISHLYLRTVWVFYFLTYLDNEDQVLAGIVGSCWQAVSLGHSAATQWKEWRKIRPFPWFQQGCICISWRLHLHHQLLPSTSNDGHGSESLKKNLVTDFCLHPLRRVCHHQQIFIEVEITPSCCFYRSLISLSKGKQKRCFWSILNYFLCLCTVPVLVHSSLRYQLSAFLCITKCSLFLPGLSNL